MLSADIFHHISYNLLLKRRCVQYEDGNHKVEQKSTQLFTVPATFKIITTYIRMALQVARKIASFHMALNICKHF